MASSKLKQPPVSHQKRSTEAVGSTACDQNLFTAFKKLRVDVNGECVKRTEDRSEEPLKHKPDTSTASNSDHREKPAQQTIDSDEWSQSLQKFCFCDEGTINKNGRARLKSMCRFHRLLARKGSSEGGSKNSLNLARAVRAHKPLLQEGRLKVCENKSEQPPQFMRCARFEFSHKPVTFGDTKCVKKLGTASMKSKTDVASVSASASATGTSESPAGSQKTEKETTKHPQPTSKETTEHPKPVFAASLSDRLSSFSSLHSQSSHPTQSSHSGPSYEGYRGICHRHALWPQATRSAPNTTSVLCAEDSVATASPPTATTVVPSRADLAVERSCSQEARLDEGEFSVNELAAYFDNFLYMPKEMSSMAQMMYT